MRKRRVVYVLSTYPQISQTYIHAEIAALQEDHEIKVFAQRAPNLAAENALPYEVVAGQDALLREIENFQPDVLHTHYLHMLNHIGPLAERSGIPFTLRTHSFDVLTGRTSRSGVKSILADLAHSDALARYAPTPRRKAVSFINHELCLGALAFPFVRPLLEKYGADEEKIIDCFPVIDYAAFYDRTENGDAVMNVGAALPKKQMEDFIRLGTLAPELTFNLYAMGYDVEKLEKANRDAGSPIHIVPPVQPLAMPAEYKKHRWLVYTASFELRNVGWPMAIAEAQAAGVGVCMPNIRPDVAEYIDRAGFIYDSIEDVVDVVRGPVPHDMREAGFEKAKRSDIRSHIHLLTDLWESAPAGAVH